MTKIRIRLVRQRPAHHSARVKIHNDSQVMPFPLSPDVGDVATPDLIRRRHIKLSIQDVRNVRPLNRRLFVGM